MAPGIPCMRQRKQPLYGFDGASAGVTGAFKGVTVGSQVVAHYTVSGSKLTAVSVRKIGAAGLTATEGTVQAFDKGRQDGGVKTADGSVQSFKLAEGATATATQSRREERGGRRQSSRLFDGNRWIKIAHFVRAL